MRVAKVVSWVVLVGLALPNVVVMANSPNANPAGLVALLPPGMALAVYHVRSLSWLRWPALVVNVLSAVLGLFLVVAAVLGLLGVAYFAVASPVIAIPLGAIALLLPGAVNVRALWLNGAVRTRSVGHDG
jgi:hypothetical protein